jgi:hypothetical protein
MIRCSAIGFALAVAAILSLACSSSQDFQPPAAPPVEVEQRMPTINHVTPARDSVGAQPTKFEWTAADGADRYMIGVWDDVDRVVWRADRVTGTSVMMPDDIELGFGTYFWMVTAMRDDRPIAESGRSAFVVR